MLRLKDLSNRIYNGKQCIGFQLAIDSDSPAGDKKQLMEATYKRDGFNGNLWVLQVLFPRSAQKDTDVYCFAYSMPRPSMPLELIAATGLKYFQHYLQKEIQEKQAIDFAIGDIVEGM